MLEGGRNLFGICSQMVDPGQLVRDPPHPANPKGCTARMQ